MTETFSRRAFLAQAAAAALPESPDTLRELVPGLMRKAEVPGLAMSVIRDGKPYWSAEFGVRNMQSREPVTGATVFEAASLSKPVVAYAALKMVEEGLFGLDDSLSNYLPASYLPGEPRLKMITLRRVLSHTTGFPNWRPRGKPLAMQFTPGERFSYSGEGFVYLQKVMEQFCGRPFADCMQSMVLRALGMGASSFVWREDFDTVAAQGHDGEGKPRPKNRPAQANAASSLHTTALDFTRFLFTMLRGGLADEMLAPQVEVEPGLSWGLGWGIERSPAGDFFWQWGDNEVFQSFAMGNRNDGSAVVILTNSANGLKICEEIVAAAIGGRHKAFDYKMVRRR